MENKTVIGFIGAGNMAYALIKGLLSNGFDAKNIKKKRNLKSYSQNKIIFLIKSSSISTISTSEFIKTFRGQE